MQHVGYSLIDSNFIEIEYWGNTLGQAVSAPNVIILPQGISLHSPIVNVDYFGYKLIERYIDANPPSPWHSPIDHTITCDGEKTVVTYIYPTEPNITPSSVTPLQMRKALRQANLKSLVDGYVATLTEDQAEEWEYATEIDRNHPLINAAATAVGKTEEDLDNLFRLASTL